MCINTNHYEIVSNDPQCSLTELLREGLVCLSNRIPSLKDILEDQSLPFKDMVEKLRPVCKLVPESQELFLVYKHLQYLTFVYE